VLLILLLLTLIVEAAATVKAALMEQVQPLKVLIHP